MADLKISQLGSIITVVPATDVLPVVQGGTTYKITPNQILGAGGTATLATATITGALTVDTSTLVVDSTNHRVGIGTTNTFKPLTVQAGSTGSATINQGLVINSSAAYGVGQGVSYSSLVFSRNRSVDTSSLNASVEIFGGNAVETSGDGGVLGFRTQNAAGTLTDRYTIDNTGISTWSVAGSTAMTLNATGLGIGASPSYKLDVNGVVRVSNGDGVFLSGAASPDLYVIGVNYYNNSGTEGVQVSSRPSWKIEHKNSSDALAYLDIGFRAASAAASAFTSRFSIDGTGNVLIGSAAVATTATNGFLYVTGCTGTPTGTPTAKTGRVPIVVDTTNNKLYFYSGGAWIAAN